MISLLLALSIAHAADPAEAPAAQSDASAGIEAPAKSSPRRGQREITLNVGILNSDDQNWEMFAEGDVLPSFGARFGYPVVKHFKVVAGYEYGQGGSHVSVYDESGEDGENNGFDTGFFSHQALIGGKVHWSPSSWVTLYGIAQGDVMFATVKIDDDPDDDENPGQIERGGVSAGVIAAAGVGVNVPFKGDKMAWEVHAELGYGYIAPLEIEEIGKLEFSGVSFRVGTGLVF